MRLNTGFFSKRGLRVFSLVFGVCDSTKKDIQSINPNFENISQIKVTINQPKKKTIASEVHLLCLLSEVEGFFLYRCLCLFLHVIDVELLLTPTVPISASCQLQRKYDLLYVLFLVSCFSS